MRRRQTGKCCVVVGGAEEMTERQGQAYHLCVGCHSLGGGKRSKKKNQQKGKKKRKKNKNQRKMEIRRKQILVKKFKAVNIKSSLKRKQMEELIKNMSWILQPQTFELLLHKNNYLPSINGSYFERTTSK